MRLGAITLPTAPWAELVERWRVLDELGFETIWAPDHLANPLDPEGRWYEGWTTLTGLALATERARVGTLVSSITLRNPAVLAKAAASVDRLSGGRMELGVGAGGAPLDHELAGVENWPPPERARRLRAFAERLVSVLGDERVPLTIGGMATGTLRLAAELADRWSSYGGRGLRPAEAAAQALELNRKLDGFCAEAGRDPASIVRSVLIGYPFIAETPWRSPEAFAELVERWEAAGMNEIVVYYPPETGMPEGTVEPGVFEQVMREQLGDR